MLKYLKPGWFQSDLRLYVYVVLMSIESGTLRVLVIEHNPILLEGLSQLISEFLGAEIVGVAASAAAGIELFVEKRPTITIVDLELPDTSLVELVQRIRRIDADVPILTLATYELDPIGAQVISSGATAIIAKDQIASMLLPLIRRFAGVRPDLDRHP
jgi:DNA-binding NarL/FixJ family response regulator